MLMALSNQIKTNKIIKILIITIKAMTMIKAKIMNKAMTMTRAKIMNKAMIIIMTKAIIIMIIISSKVMGCVCLVMRVVQDVLGKMRTSVSLALRVLF
jgi:hypothetical protein